jgi:hypothetical protein
MYRGVGAMTEMRGQIMAEIDIIMTEIITTIDTTMTGVTITTTIGETGGKIPEGLTEMKVVKVIGLIKEVTDMIITEVVIEILNLIILKIEAATEGLLEIIGALPGGKKEEINKVIRLIGDKVVVVVHVILSQDRIKIIFNLNENQIKSNHSFI